MTLIFFFQAEDGIRYLIVTGVQTCALPISEDQQQQVAQPQAARTLTLRVPQVAQRRELRLGRCAALEQMQQRGDRRRGEPQQRQRMEERPASKRRAMPNGMSVRM